MRTSRPLIAALGLAALLGAGTTSTPAWADDENGTSHSYGYDNNERKKPKKGAVTTPACADFVPGGGGTTDADGLGAGAFAFESFLAGTICADGVYELTITDAVGLQTVVADTSASAGEARVQWLASVVPDANGCVTVTARAVLGGVEADTAPDPGTVEEVCTGSPGSISWR